VLRRRSRSRTVPVLVQHSIVPSFGNCCNSGFLNKCSLLCCCCCCIRCGHCQPDLGGSAARPGPRTPGGPAAAVAGAARLCGNGHAAAVQLRVGRGQAGAEPGAALAAQDGPAGEWCCCWFGLLDFLCTNVCLLVLQVGATILCDSGLHWLHNIGRRVSNRLCSAC
jgi:hypothetical protein